MKKIIYFIPLIITIASTTLYQISAKQVPSSMNSGAILVIAYAMATTFSLILFIITEKASIFAEVEGYKTKFQFPTAALLMGIAITGAEMGNILVYRSGWDLSIAGTFTNISVAVILVIVGRLLYKEKIDKNKSFGIIICLLGLIILGI
ncbi:MAG TPA: DUF2101 family protein [Anaerovoracaceae bacterium]|nr:DUF2101 family protein [Anaerovoracaceae bacterium]